MDIRQALVKYKNNELDLNSILSMLPFEETGCAKIDHSRVNRTGYPEVIFGEGKQPEVAADIFSRMVSVSETVLCTRTPEETANAILKLIPKAIYHKTAKIVVHSKSAPVLSGLVAVVTGGSSDINIAEEAAVTLEAFGSEVIKIYDAGVAGLHRLLIHQDILNRANCIIAIAGMEGALASVISGLVKVPVIAVPTSAGYGANLSGIAPLLGMLCSCAPGVSVVNIDNGFGAAYQANLINQVASK